MDRDQELDFFKREVDFVQFALDRGYQLRRRESSRSSKVLVHPTTGDKIIVTRRAHDDHWVYFSVRDAADNGTVIDFVQNRGGRLGLGKVRLELRRWLGRSPQPQTSSESYVVPSNPDRVRATAAYERARPASNSEYLNARGIRPATLSDPRFVNSWRIDRRGNVLFVHRDADGITGFELKNDGFTGFAPGGTKSLWYSTARKTDERLVIVETAIDALSYHQLHPHPHARYVSTAGEPSREQMRLIERAIAKMPTGSEIIGACDNDASGRRLADELEHLTGVREGLRFQRHAPVDTKDWNDVLRKTELAYIRTVLLAQRSERDPVQRRDPV